MTDFLKVVGHTGLVRDTSSGAIINTNRTEYEEDMARRKFAEDRENLIRQNAEDITNLKTEMHDIKSMLQQLLNRK